MITARSLVASVQEKSEADLAVAFGSITIEEYVNRRFFQRPMHRQSPAARLPHTLHVYQILES